ncbi:arsenate reductase ArsC [Aliiglaciecola sp. LCG003]|uniref:arsenate reductase ArsC n=1 Tax=Aliiglaciecola sp. LCG003 TaxID=3053655 RepID=UPI002572D0DE|nr:arsenate reductase ArsC [Aliiglaciecola sp. LCG003]WJG10426.1 arsenate reductase ArsC [Aliiglaciecola sp. LCG003]
MKILYICTHNRCRSILSEAITNQNAAGLIVARSAGSQPAGQVHPLSLRYLQETGYAIDGLSSQSWDDFEQFNPDVVITVCDSAAGETCPLYFTQSIKVHWGLSDPSKITGTDEQKHQAFLACISEIAARVEDLKAIANKQLKGDALRTALAEVGAN